MDAPRGWRLAPGPGHGALDKAASSALKQRARSHRDASLRVEYRHDFSSKSDAFGPGKSGQDTVALALHYAF